MNKCGRGRGKGEGKKAEEERWRGGERMRRRRGVGVRDKKNVLKILRVSVRQTFGTGESI